MEKLLTGQATPTAKSAPHGDLASAYAAGDYQQVLDIADAVLSKDPGDVSALRFRADALTFLMRHEDAIPAYADAIRAVERALREDELLLFGEDPRGGLHFNRGCELARLGRHDEALQDLEAAIGFQGRWAEAATKDDYWTPLRDEAAFKNLIGSGRAAEDVERQVSFGHLQPILQRVALELEMFALEKEQAARLLSSLQDLVVTVERDVAGKDPTSAQKHIDDEFEKTTAVLVAHGLTVDSFGDLDMVFVGLANRAGLKALAKRIRAR